MKKLKVFMAVALMFTMVAPVFASNLTQDVTSGTMNVSYGVNGVYTISIPDTLNFGTDLTKTAEVEVSNVLIEHGKSLKLEMTSANEYNLKNQNSAIAYTVKSGETTFSATNKEVISVEAGNPDTTTNAELTFATTEEAIAAATLSGQHTDTLTFTASIQ